VHGLAAPLGAFFPIPHGVVCGTLVATCSEANLRALMQRAMACDPSNGLPRWALESTGMIK
jgi:alcohol dehydrogenase